MKTRNKIGKELANIRIDLNYTQDTIAKKMDVSLDRIKKVELGNAKNIDFYVEYANFLGYTITLNKGDEEGLLMEPISSLTKQIRVLLGDDFFSVPQLSSDVQEKLIEIGFLDNTIDTIKIANALISLEKQGEIKVDRSNSNASKYYK
ncbi:helix-turn-helix domain-containing protein [Myroides odoratimimus]|uniref:helix-turn-helix domain-containing protein n=1 Tax=Myroides odoratimimus TaxID=76832 RepID=UPI002575DAF8|nr:helix-turn-helix transcriptional regulator [Myroides odoratimimus]MEC4043650.1 helix-turn-helix transcriptional regulator [Myroides odoratimimus]MEC4151486.1 helix-turn-helix transcriptional regulator [Myroides odoratimimus]